MRRQLSAMGLKGCVAVKKLLLREGNRQKRRTFANQTKKLLDVSRDCQWTDHPKVQTSTSLNVFGIILVIRSRKFLKLWCCGKIALKISLKTESRPPRKNGICNECKGWAHCILKMLLWLFLEDVIFFKNIFCFF